MSEGTLDGGRRRGRAARKLLLNMYFHKETAGTCCKSNVWDTRTAPPTAAVGPPAAEGVCCFPLPTLGVSAGQKARVREEPVSHKYVITESLISSRQ